MGCEKPKAEKTDAPKTFSSVVSELVEMKNVIRDAFAANDPDKAHGPLHEVGHAIGELSGLAAKANLSADQMNSLKSACDTLMDAFGEIDKTFHGGEGKTYDEVASDIHTSMQTVTRLAGVMDNSEAPAAKPADSESKTPETVEVQDADAPEDVEAQDADAPDEKDGDN